MTVYQVEGNCCCSGTGSEGICQACSLSFPPELDFTTSNIVDEECGSCSNLNDTWTLPLDGICVLSGGSHYLTYKDYFSVNWEWADFGPVCTEESILEVGVTIVWTPSIGQQGVNAWLSYSGTDFADAENTFIYADNNNETAFDCTAFSDLVIPASVFNIACEAGSIDGISGVLNSP